ncbi:NAD-specific glutamate dehydrogenase [compost metagenome]
MRAGPQGANRADPERVRTHVGHDDLFKGLVFHLQARHHRGARRHDQIRIHLRIGKTAEHTRNQLAHQRHARGATGQHHCRDIRTLDVRVLQRTFHRHAQARQQRRAQLCKQLLAQFQRVFLVLPAHSHARFRLRRQLPFGTLGLRQ